MTTTVGFYVKAGVETGYGHIVRCLALADELKRQGAQCYFYTNEQGAEYLQSKRRMTQEDVDLYNSGKLEIDVSNTNEDVQSFDIYIIDLEDGTPLSIAQRFRPFCKTLVILNGVGYPDGDPGRLLADLVFYQGVTDRPAALDWTGFKGQWFVGPEYLILRDEFRGPQFTQPSQAKPRIIITGGGSDPKNITLKALQAIESDDIEYVALVGPANKFDYIAAGYPRIVRNPRNVVAELAWADVAVVSYGMTAFECLALGIPTVALSISPDHKASADLVQQQSGCALDSLGEVADVHRTEIQEAVYLQLARRAILSKQARDFVDGRGTERVAGLILEVAQ